MAIACSWCTSDTNDCKSELTPATAVLMVCYYGATMESLSWISDTVSCFHNARERSVLLVPSSGTDAVVKYWSDVQYQQNITIHFIFQAGRGQSGWAVLRFLPRVSQSNGQDFGPVLFPWLDIADAEIEVPSAEERRPSKLPSLWWELVRNEVWTSCQRRSHLRTNQHRYKSLQIKNSSRIENYVQVRSTNWGNIDINKQIGK